MNQNKKKAFLDVFKKFEEEISLGYVPESFSEKILNNCGVAGLFAVKDLFEKNDPLGLIPIVDRFIASDYKLDDWNNLYNKDGSTLVSFNEDNCIERFEIPDGVMTIGDNAFKDNENIIEVLIPDSVTRIGNSAFSGCKNLQKVWMGKGLGQTNLWSGSNIFYDCQKLKEIHVDRIEDIKNFKHDNNPFTASFDLYVGETLYNTDITIQKECESAVELDWIIFCKSIRKVYSDSDKVSCRDGYIINYEKLSMNGKKIFPLLCIEDFRTVEQLKEFGREHHLDISDETCFECLQYVRSNNHESIEE